MPSGYYSDAAGEKKALPVNAHSHTLDRTQFDNVGASNDGSTTDPKPGQGLFWVGNDPDDPNPGKWFAGDAPTKAPVNETVLANWFEPTSWNPPGVDNPDGAAGTWRPDQPVTGGDIFSWDKPDSFGIASETVDGYIRLQTSDSITVEWGREEYSGARPIPYGVSGTDKSAGEYTYKISVLTRALKDFTGATGPWVISVGFAFYSNNVIRDDTLAPQPASTPVVWGVNQLNITDTYDPDTWVNIECYMNGRVSVGDVPTDAAVGTYKTWNDLDPDAPHDGYYFCPVIKVEGANADVLIDSVQVFRGPRQLTAPGGVLATSVNVEGQDASTIIQPGTVFTNAITLTEIADTELPMLDGDVLEVNDQVGSPPDSTFFEEGYESGFAFPQSPAKVVSAGLEFTPNAAPTPVEAQAKWRANADNYTLSFRADYTYRITAIVNAPSGSKPWRVGFGVLADSTDQTPDGTDQSITYEWTPTEDTQDVPTFSVVAGTPTDWATVGGPWTLKYFQVIEVGPQPGKIIGLRDPIELSEPVTKGWLESQDLGGGNTNIVHVPTVAEPEPVENPAEPFEDGSIWANPTAPTGVPVVFMWEGIDTETLVTATSFADIPNWERMEFTAPGPGMLQMIARYEAITNGYRLETRIYPEDNGAHSYFIDRSNRVNMGSGTYAIRIGLMCMGIAFFDSPGTTVFRYQTQANGSDASYPKITNAHVWCTWTPGAVYLDHTQNVLAGGKVDPNYAPLVRIRSSNTWTPTNADTLPGKVALDPTSTVQNAGTTTTISGGGTQNGGSRTLTATVSGPGTPVGSVQFKKSGTVIATKTLSNGKATHSVSSSGSYSANYLGGQSGSYNYLASPSTSTTVTIRTLKTGSYDQSYKWACSFRYTGDKRTTNTQYTYEGYAESYQGNLTSAIGFNRLNVSNFYDVTKVQVRMRCVHSWNSGGKDCDIGWHTATGGEPGSIPGSTRNRQAYYIGKGAEKTVDITSWAKSVVTRSDFGGIFMGGTANNNHYGYFDDTRWYLWITYRYWG